ncbi:hypothetical protein GOODEAATRI_008566 [Goodea atripinnis]|uniref:Uncharacterized protein n=1 Tax=Goodea atripinnis TaxID=208336 RepID=A0ABV0N9B2_9TELE
MAATSCPEAENLQTKTNCAFHRVSMFMILQLFPFHCGCTPACKEIRSSLVLSMLQQMLAEDKADMVREAVVKSLGIIMGYIDDSDKYAQGFELMLLSLGDPSERVVNAVHQVFIPAFSAWTTELGTLHTALIPSLLSRIEKLLTDMAIIIGSRELLSSLLLLYDHQLEHEGTTGWESLLWVVNQLLPQLIEIVGRINVTSSTCVHEFSRFFWRFCRTFGKIFTNTKSNLSSLKLLQKTSFNLLVDLWKEPTALSSLYRSSSCEVELA